MKKIQIKRGKNYLSRKKIKNSKTKKKKTTIANNNDKNNNN